MGVGCAVNAVFYDLGMLWWLGAGAALVYIAVSAFTFVARHEKSLALVGVAHACGGVFTVVAALFWCWLVWILTHLFNCIPDGCGGRSPNLTPWYAEVGYAAIVAVPLLCIAGVCFGTALYACKNPQSRVPVVALLQGKGYGAP